MLIIVIALIASLRFSLLSSNYLADVSIAFFASELIKIGRRIVRCQAKVVPALHPSASKNDMRMDDLHVLSGSQSTGEHSTILLHDYMVLHETKCQVPQSSDVAQNLLLVSIYIVILHFVACYSQSFHFERLIALPHQSSRRLPTPFAMYPYLKCPLTEATVLFHQNA